MFKINFTQIFKAISKAFSFTSSIIQPEPRLKAEQVPVFKIPSNTIIMMCGPTGSGKSTLSAQIQEGLEVYYNRSCRVLSSDDIRRSLLDRSDLNEGGDGYEVGRYSPLMMAASAEAFKRLEQDLDTLTSFPYNTDVVILDTTAMDENFRKRVRAISKKNGYHLSLVTFEYKTRSDYFKVAENEYGQVIVEKSVARFRQKVLSGGFGVDSHDSRVRIRSRGEFGHEHPLDQEVWFNNFLDKRVVKEVDRLDSTRIYYNNEYPVAVIGDSHECTEELKELVQKIESSYPNAIIIHCGDYLDKGGDTKNMVEFMYKCVSQGHKVLHANHESYLYKRLKGDIDPNEELEEKYFTALKVLLKDQDLAQKFIEICHSTIPFAKLIAVDGSYLPAYVTHAPCGNRYIGKTDKASLKLQRNYRINDRTKPIQEELDWLYKEADSSLPLHLFGHVSHFHTEMKGLRYKNKVFLDTGAVYGGKLTAAIIKQGRITNVIQVDSKSRVESDKAQEIPQNLGFGPAEKEEPFDISKWNLSSSNLRLIDQIEANGIKYISGTMAPAPSTSTDIESFEEALKLFKATGAKELIVQPKYMGSRAQLYLFKDAPEKAFLVSRSGWRVKKVDGVSEEKMPEFLKSLHEQFEGLVKTAGDVIIDGELMPWSALGKGLIDNSFIPYIELANSEFDWLKAQESDLPLDLKGKIDFASRKSSLESFIAALNRYRGDTGAYFIPFKILQVQNQIQGLPGIERNNLFSYAELSTYCNKVEGGPRIERSFCVISQTPEGEWNTSDVKEAFSLFEELTSKQGMEGVVIKPVVEEENCVPYIKVRSKEYLRLVYGHSYLEPERYKKLCAQKNVRNKLKLSISEVKLANTLLNTPLDQKESRIELIVKMIAEMQKEQTLDPRL